MKRFSDNISPGRWKRICPPPDDSESDSSAESDDTLYRRLYRYGSPNCAQCGYCIPLCSCNVRQSLNNTPRQSMILLPASESNDRSEGAAGNNGSNEATSSHQPRSSSSSNHQSGLGSMATASGIADTSGDGPSVSFRASTRIEQFTIRETSNNPLLRYPCSVTRRILIPDLEDTPSFHSAAELFNLSRDKRLKESTTEVVEAGSSQAQSAVDHVVLEETPTSEQPTTTNELDEFHARLLSLIECPVCLEPIAPPVNQCRRGHLVCGKCRSQLNQCPTCRDKMCEMRNWAVERIAELLKYPCRNAGLGCPVATLLAGKNAHELTCPFRHYNCLFRTCSWTGFQQEMLPHLRSTHPLRFLEGTRQHIDVELNSPTLFYTDWAISCFGRIFRFNVFQHIPNSMFYASAYLVAGGGGAAGCGNTESDFTYTVTVNGALGRRASYTRQTHTEATRTSQLCHSEDCFSIRGDKLEHFVRDGGKLRLHVELEQLETCPDGEGEGADGSN